MPVQAHQKSSKPRPSEAMLEVKRGRQKESSILSSFDTVRDLKLKEGHDSLSFIARSLQICDLEKSNASHTPLPFGPRQRGVEISPPAAVSLHLGESHASRCDEPDRNGYVIQS